jgi:hypothetical protein
MQWLDYSLIHSFPPSPLLYPYSLSPRFFSFTIHAYHLSLIYFTYYPTATLYRPPRRSFLVARRRGLSEVCLDHKSYRTYFLLLITFLTFIYSTLRHSATL